MQLKSMQIDLLYVPKTKISAFMSTFQTEKQDTHYSQFCHFYQFGETSRTIHIRFLLEILKMNDLKLLFQQHCKY